MKEKMATYKAPYDYLLKNNNVDPNFPINFE